MGTLPRLKRASLLIESSRLPGLSAKGGPFFDDEQKIHHVRQDLINSAVDSSLALAIFRAISTTNALQYLRLQVSMNGTFAGDWADGDFINIVHWIGRKWVCTRDSDGGKIIARRSENGREWNGRRMSGWRETWRITMMGICTSGFGKSFGLTGKRGLDGGLVEFSAFRGEGEKLKDVGGMYYARLYPSTWSSVLNH